MGVIIFKTKFSAIHKTENLFFSTRINEYRKKFEIKDSNRPLSYFLKTKNKYTLGQLRTADYDSISETKTIPIIDQSVNLIAGYTDETDLIYTGDLPVIVFGDHTRIFKYIDFPFVQGADGIKILCPDPTKINPQFFFYLLRAISVPNRGYNRHFSLLSIQRYPLVDMSIQHQIIHKIQPTEAEISALKASKIKPLDIINEVFAEIFGFDAAFYKTLGKGMTAGTQQCDTPSKSIYKIPFSQIQKSNLVRISGRFHNPKTQFLTDKLFSKPTTKVKNIIVEKVHRGSSPDYDADGDIPVVKTAHIKNGFIEISTEEFVSLKTYTNTVRAQIFKNDVLIASTGKVSLGKVDIVDTDQILVVDGHISIIRVDDKQYNPLFLTYFLRSMLGAFQIERDFTGATNQIELYTAEIENFDIPNFTLEKQNDIVRKIQTQIEAQNDIDVQIAQKQAEINTIIENAIQAA